MVVIKQPGQADTSTNFVWFDWCHCHVLYIDPLSGTHHTRCLFPRLEYDMQLYTHFCAGVQTVACWIDELMQPFAILFL